LIKGGLLYDKWWVAAGTDEPEGTNPVYPTEENAMFKDPPRSGPDTWRCKECHGWDYLGVDGFYGPPSSHFTNIEGVLQLSDFVIQSKNEGDHSPQEIHDIIAFGIIGQMAAYEGLISDDGIWDLTKFIVDGLIDNRLIVDYSSPDMNEIIPPIDLDNGETLFNNICADCHGVDGEGLAAFGTEGISLNDVALGNPVEFMHKIRMGQPATIMPSMVKDGYSTNDAKDVLAWAQTLVPPVPGEGCCDFGDNDCEDGLGIIGCEKDGGVFIPGVMCVEVDQCNVEPPLDAGCCFIAEGTCSESLGIEGCADSGGMFNPDVMCSTIPDCSVAPDGAALYADTCAGCHGVDAMGTPIAPNIVGKTAQDIINANMQMGLSPAEVDAVADFLGSL
jgi:mono/diheme cytochrome c family protein